MTNLVFVHGWGFDASLWDCVIAHLPDEISCTLIDFGFTGNASNESSPFPESAICVGHSLGALWLLQNMTRPAGFISIGGFDCFTKHIPPANIKAMQRNLQRDMEAQMKGFYEACDVEYRAHNFNKEKLSQGLEILRTWDAGNKLKSLSCPVTALTAADDKIVPLGMSQKIWTSAQLKTIKTGGHALPLTQAEFCAQHIQKMMERLT